jgi:hypothetical protein
MGSRSEGRKKTERSLANAPWLMEGLTGRSVI